VTRPLMLPRPACPKAAETVISKTIEIPTRSRQDRRQFFSRLKRRLPSNQTNGSTLGLKFCSEWTKTGQNALFKPFNKPY
jgi:hypothetical protein